VGHLYVAIFPRDVGFEILMSPYLHVRCNLNAYTAHYSQGFQSLCVTNKVRAEAFDEPQQTILVSWRAPGSRFDSRNSSNRSPWHTLPWF